MKKYLYLLLGFIVLMSFNSCLLPYLLIELGRENGSYGCSVSFTNNSEHAAYIGSVYYYSRSVSSKELTDGVFDYKGCAPADTRNGRYELWGFSEDSKDVSWVNFFNTCHLDSFAIVVADSQDKLFLWDSQRNDTLLVKKYVFTLQNLISGDRGSVTISYP